MSMDEENKPPYVKNPREAQERVCEALLRGQTTRLKHKLQTWKVTSPALPRQQSLDIKYGTIYCMKADLVDSTADRQTLEREVTDCSSLNLDSAREKLYIRESTQPPSTHRDNSQLLHYVIKQYKQPDPPSSPTHTTPRLTHRGSVSEVVDLFVKERSGYKVKAKRQRVKRCKKTNTKTCQFCEVLGPVSCAMCIERTDRHFAERAEQKTLPAVDSSVSNLVASGLSKSMEKGTKLMQNTTREAEISSANVLNLPPI